MNTSSSLANRIRHLGEQAKPVTPETAQMLRKVKKWANPEDAAGIDNILSLPAGGAR